MRIKTILICFITALPVTMFAQRKNVAILVFNGVQIIDYTGPYEVLGQAGFNVFTVSNDTATILTAMQMKVIPSYSFSNAPQADILVIPGGRIPHDLPKNDPIVQWILKQYEKTEWVLGVCNGSFVLGSCGLLDGKRATTNSGMVNHLGMAGVNIKPVLDERFVQDGKIITTGGLSAGIDGALFIVSKIFNEARARVVANNMEYNWEPAANYARGKLADLLISQAIDFNPPLRSKKIIVYEGNEQQWRSEYIIKRDETASEFYQQFIELVKDLSNTRWKKQKEEVLNGKISSAWQITDVAKKEWSCIVIIGPAGDPGELHLVFDIKRI